MHLYEIDGPHQVYTQELLKVLNIEGQALTLLKHFLQSKHCTLFFYLTFPMEVECCDHIWYLVSYIIRLFKMCFNVFFKQEIKIHIQVIAMISLKLLSI